MPVTRCPTCLNVILSEPRQVDQPLSWESHEPKPPDPFAGPRECAKNHLTGKCRQIIETLCDRGGSIRLADLAKTLSWKGKLDGRFQSRKTAINTVFKKRLPGWIIERKDNSAVLRKKS